eukprot:m.42839 g.42839  ORF g.42839 m.42839 type:complete len:362 (-) comp9915_c0_seq1:134-1219(-)
MGSTTWDWHAVGIGEEDLIQRMTDLYVDGRPGQFLVRELPYSPQCYLLCTKTNDAGIRNLLIEPVSQGEHLMLGLHKRENEKEVFLSLEELVRYYCENENHIIGGKLIISKQGIVGEALCQREMLPYTNPRHVTMLGSVTKNPKFKKREKNRVRVEIPNNQPEISEEVEQDPHYDLSLIQQKRDVVTAALEKERQEISELRNEKASLTQMIKDKISAENKQLSTRDSSSQTQTPEPTKENDTKQPAIQAKIEKQLLQVKIAEQRAKVAAAKLNMKNAELRLQAQSGQFQEKSTLETSRNDSRSNEEENDHEMQDIMNKSGSKEDNSSMGSQASSRSRRLQTRPGTPGCAVTRDSIPESPEE